MVGINQFWVCTMGPMEAVDKLLTKRDIDCLNCLTNVTCRDFQYSLGFELRFNFDIKTNKCFMDELLIKRYAVSNILLDNKPILKNVTGCDIHWKQVRRLTYRNVKKKQRFNSSGRTVQIYTVKKRERTNSLSHFLCKIDFIPR